MTGKKYSITIVFALALFLVGCKKPTEACMELSTTSTSVGTPIEFTSCSENALSYEWFIEGPVDAPENEMGWSDPYFSNTFTVSGSYVITLHAYSNFSFLGERSTIEQSFSVN